MLALCLLRWLWLKIMTSYKVRTISQNDVVIIWWGQPECKWLQQNWNVDADGKIEIDMSRLMSVTLHCISKSPSSSVSDWRTERLWRCFSDCGVIKRYRKIGRPPYYSGKGISGTTNSLSPCATHVFVFSFFSNAFDDSATKSIFVMYNFWCTV